MYVYIHTNIYTQHTTYRIYMWYRIFNSLQGGSQESRQVHSTSDWTDQLIRVDRLIMCLCFNFQCFSFFHLSPPNYHLTSIHSVILTVTVIQIHAHIHMLHIVVHRLTTHKTVCLLLTERFSKRVSRRLAHKKRVRMRSGFWCEILGKSS